ncbi:sulfatase [Lutibacter sp. A80]|uniref:sulfatase n=1 Tax=Lutibacter sp. A80 TaxID=2918453 RepID=UPI001F05DD47|nr:sulfatase [Lutibacter sp. A80]UMB61698.1 sulfatase [Lutibacter sp. A80]
MKNILFTCLFCLGTMFNYAQKKPNILFIAIDDLRPELGCYGSEIAITPNMDKLASEGLLFNNAYCQQAICGPSRASLMTGVRPSTSGVTHNYIRFREKLPQVNTIAQHFNSNGYQSVYYGKIFHHGDEDEISWTRPQLKSNKKPVGFALPENNKIRKETREKMFAKYGEVAKYGLAMGPAYECADVPDDTYSDGLNTDLAIQTIKDMVKEDGKPFFLGLGFHKPHLNWVAPKKYWDLYNEEDIKLATQTTAPINGAEMGIHPSFELRVRSGIPKSGKLDKQLSITLKHAYLACVSYVDAQIGKVINALDEAGIKDNTIIVLWGDHGWHLGEMGIWGKATNYEIATRVPMMIYTPDMLAKNRGAKTNALVELVDIYPTLSDLAGIEIPKHLEGKSFKPLLKNPSKKWKKAVFSQFPSPALREWGAFPIRPAMRETYFGLLLKEVEDKIKLQQKEKWDRVLFENYLMGYAMRTDDYRFVIWKDSRNQDSKPVQIELFDHKIDPEETINIANEHPKLVSKLLKVFKKEWKKAHKSKGI